MGALSKVLRNQEGGRLAFWCPGCQEPHVISPHIWAWNGSAEAPTFQPSVLITGGHYARPDQPECWCSYNAQHPDDPAPFKCMRCHSWVRDGQIQFLNDCTHGLAGRTVPLPPWPEESE